MRQQTNAASVHAFKFSERLAIVKLCVTCYIDAIVNSKSKASLHRLLGHSRIWNGEQRSEALDYLERRCTVRDVLALCDFAGHPEAARPADDGRLHKSLTLSDLLHLITPKELIAAWERVREERMAERADRAAATTVLDRPSIAEALLPIFERMSGTELAALYLGHVELLLNLQRQQLDGRSGPSLSGRISTAHAFQMRLEDALDWLAHRDITKAQAASLALSTSRREAALRMAARIDRIATARAA